MFYVQEHGKNEESFIDEVRVEISVCMDPVHIKTTPERTRCACMGSHPGAE